MFVCGFGRALSRYRAAIGPTEEALELDGGSQCRDSLAVIGDRTVSLHNTHWPFDLFAVLIPQFFDYLSI